MLMTEQIKRVISFVLVFGMLISLFPQGIALEIAATETENTVSETVDDTVDASDAESTDVTGETGDEESTLLWNYNIIEGGVELTGYRGSSQDVYIPSTIKVGDTEYRVLRLADGIFQNNDGINSATLGAGIFEIGARAFYDCDSLACVLIAEETTTIGAEAFYGCDSFNSIILYDAVTSIGTDAFAGCPNAVLWVVTGSYGYDYAYAQGLAYKFVDSTEASPETVTVDGIEYYIMNGGAYAIKYTGEATEVVIPSTVSYYPVVELRGTFNGNTTITSVTIPDTVKVINTNTFYGCTALTSVNIPKGVTKIGDYAFYKTNITELTLPGSLTATGANAFRECKSLKTVILENGITTISDYSFYSCSAMISILLPDTLEVIGSYAFRSCSSITNIDLPDRLNSIGSYAFYCCTVLTSIVIPDNVSAINTMCFYYCYALESVSLPANLKTICTAAFYGCRSLKSINVPDNVYIDGSNSSPFYNCSSLETVIIGKNVTISYSNYSYLFQGAPIKTLITASYLKSSIGITSSLETLVLDEKITSIESGVFANASRLLSAVIPSTVSTMYADSFAPNTVLMVYENSYAHEFAVDNDLLYFIYDGTNEPEFVTENGITYYVADTYAVAVAFDGSVTDVVIPEKVGGKPVTKVCTIFNGCIHLKSVIMPDTVTKIYANAFSGCTDLTSVTLSKNITDIPANAFYNCWHLQNVVMPECFTSIGSNAFYNCRITEMMLPEGVTSIGGSAFLNCTNLVNVTIPSSVTSIGSYAFRYTKILSIAIPEGVAKISDYTFADCSNLTRVTIPSTVTSISARAFYQSGLSEIVIPEGVTMIGESAFYGCKSLATVTIPSTVKTIYSTAFGNSGLTSLVIPEGVNTIESRAFYMCYELKSVSISSTVGTIGTQAFQACQSLTDVYIAEGVRTIGSNAFEGCSSLEEITIPGSVYNNYGGAWFSHCGSLKKVTFAEGFYHNNATIFTNCGSVEELTLPSTLSTVDSKFSCSGLKRLNLAEGIATIASGAFVNCTNLLSVIIPESVTTMYTDSFAANTVLLVYEGSYAHTFAMENDLLHFVYDGVNEPEIVTAENGVVYAVFEDRAIASGFTDTAVTEVTVAAEINGVPVTELRATFRNKSALVSVVLPDGITSIGTYTFQGCTALTTVNIPSGVSKIGAYAFDRCFALAGIVLPDVLETIGKYAFNECSNITSVNIPDGVTVIEEYTFYKCTSLKAVTGCVNLDSIERHAFFDCSRLAEISIPDDLSVIGEYAFSCCDSLTSFTVPGTVSVIGNYAFNCCETLAEVILNNGVTEIGAHAFNGCYVLASVSIPTSVTTIGDGAFASAGLESIHIPASVTTLGNNAFSSCTVLTEVTGLEGVTSIKLGTFSSCTNLKYISIPENVTLIESDAFSYCTSLTSLTVPGNVSTIYGNAFSGCTDLETLIIEEGVKTIGGAFRDCTSLKEVYIAGSVTEISDTAFNGCTSITNLTLNEGTAKIGNAFTSCENLRFVFVPDSVTDIQPTSFSSKTIWIVNDGSFAHEYAKSINEAADASVILYFVIHQTGNPDIAYGASITGNVTLSGGTAVADATVDLIYDDGTVKESVKTDANGVYKFTYAEVGTYTVRAMDSNGNTAMTQVSVKRMNVFDVILQGDPNLKLKTAWSISGTVSENEATVTLMDFDGNTIATVNTTGGAFILENISNGEYLIKAESETGSVVQEINVFDGDVSGIELVLPEAEKTASVYGYVMVESRDKKTCEKRNWVTVTLYNSDGVAIDSVKSDKNGCYIFKNLPGGNYTLVAETQEMRPDKNDKFDRMHSLTGYAYVSITDPGEYQAEDIILREEHDSKLSLGGKVTANGEHQACEVILYSGYDNEIARMTTGKNGKYTFKNVSDGWYRILAITESDGMGYTWVLVLNGKVFGETDIRVYKDQKIVEHENSFWSEVPDCKDKDECSKYKDRIAEEKRFYDGLSNKEKKQLSKSYVERLNKYVEWLAEIEYKTNDSDVKFENGGMTVSQDELKNEDKIIFELHIEKKNGNNASTNGINDEDDYKYHAMNDAAGNREIKQYYDISMTKTVDGKEMQFESVCKDTDASGKFRIVITIPEEYRGHKHYSILHEHHGEIVTLADLDDDPNTITIEVDKFSTFALTATDDDLFVEDPAEELKFSGASLTIYNNLNINYKVKKETISSIGFTQPYVVFETEGIETVVTEYSEEDDCYVFTYEDISPNRMNVPITATLYATYMDDLYSSVPFDYSITTYATNMLNKYGSDESYADLCTLLVDMLVYGNMSQEYLDYKLDSLATSTLTPEQLAFATEETPNVESILDRNYQVVEGATVVWAGAGLFLSDNVALRYKIDAESIEGLEAKITTDSGDSWTITSDKFVKTNGGYHIYFDSLTMGHMREAVYITIYQGDIAVSNTLRYSIESYAANQMEDSDEKLSNLLVAMMKYGDSACRYASK